MKNMKNWMALALVVIFIFSLAACGTKNAENKGELSGSQDADDQFAFAGDENSIYGKITSITGNEIEIAVAKKPTDDGNGANDLSGDVITPNENDVPIIGGEAIDDPTDNLEFTGETKSFTIPAGVKITNMGQEMSLSNLKKGDIISVSIGSENPNTVLAVDKIK